MCEWYCVDVNLPLSILFMPASYLLYHFPSLLYNSLIELAMDAQRLYYSRPYSTLIYRIHTSNHQTEQAHGLISSHLNQPTPNRAHTKTTQHKQSYQINQRSFSFQIPSIYQSQTYNYNTPFPHPINPTNQPTQSPRLIPYQEQEPPPSSNPQTPFSSPRTPTHQHKLNTPNPPDIERRIGSNSP